MRRSMLLMNKIYGNKEDGEEEGRPQASVLLEQQDTKFCTLVL